MTKRMFTQPLFAITISCLLLGIFSSDAHAQQVSLATPTPSPTPAATSKAPAPIKPGGVTFSGSIRLRAENWGWFETDKADDAYTFGAATLRFGFSQAKEKIEWQVEGEVPVLMGTPTNAIAPASAVGQGQLGLGATYFAASGRQDASLIFKQGFIRFKGLFGDAKSSLKIGCFEFNDGTEIAPADPTLATVKRDHIAQRLIGPFGFTHVGRSFDGLQYARNFKAGNFTFVGARPTEGVFQLNGNDDLDVDFYYGAFTKPFKFKTGESEARLFALHYHDGRRVLKTDSRLQALRTADTDNIRITTLGGHYIGVHRAGKGKVDTLLWGAGQFGQWGRLDQRSGAIAAEVGYSFAGKLKPWIRGGYFRSTGDGDPNDGRHGTFFQVLPTPRIYARTPFFNSMNNEDAFGQLRLKPHAKLGLRFDAHHLRLSNAKDLWYVGAFQKRTFGYVGRPSKAGRAWAGCLTRAPMWRWARVPRSRSISPAFAAAACSRRSIPWVARIPWGDLRIWN
ncbi:MAG: alginate export family protein [Blastocatellia bacterium]